VLVAGIGWAAASAPAALSPDGDTTQPTTALIVLSALGLGLAMGPLLGSAQAVALRGTVRHPWRWVGANTLAWPPTMVVMFLGATTPSETWSVWSIAAVAASTGLAAGTVLGLTSGWFLPSLQGTSGSGRVVLALLASRRRSGLPRALLGLEVRGCVSGRAYRLPVRYAVAPGGLVVVPGRADGKTWWRNIGQEPTPVAVLRGGGWAPWSARLVEAGDPARPVVVAAYLERWPRTVLRAEQPLIVLQPLESGQ
jgi:F0F1-type ATP synthase assembly protein I